MSAIFEITAYIIYDVISFLWDVILFFIVLPYYTLESIIHALTPDRWRHLKSLTDRVVLVTGGANGTGRELVEQLAEHHAKVVVWDVDEQGLSNLRSHVAKKTGATIFTYTVDVTDRRAVQKTAEAVRADVGVVDILINNAGVVYGRTLMELDDEMIEKTFKVNILSHYWTTRAFLPDMIGQKSGHIVSIASVAGLMGTYLCTDYSATKFAVVGFHESLYTELKTNGHDNVHTTLVCPYFINTGMFAGTRPRLMPMLDPKEVAQNIITAVRKNQMMCILPASFRFFAPLKFWLSEKTCWFIMHRVIRGPQSMSTFRGRAT